MRHPRHPRASYAILCHRASSPSGRRDRDVAGPSVVASALDLEVATRHVVAQTQHAAWRTTAQLGNGLDNCNINGLDNCNTLKYTVDLCDT